MEIDDLLSENHNSYFNFRDNYINHKNNYYSARFEELSLENSLGVKDYQGFPNSQVHLLKKFVELSKAANSHDEIPFIIYALINKDHPSGKLILRIGLSKYTPNHRLNDYKKALNAGEIGSVYQDMRTQSLKDFKMVILDIQIGKHLAEISEEFFTIYFNRDSTSPNGYDLTKNLNYNEIVGPPTFKSGSLHPAYRHIYYFELIELLERGFDEIDIACYFGVSTEVIVDRIKEWWGDDSNFVSVSINMRANRMIELFKLGFTITDQVLFFEKLAGNSKIKDYYLKSNRDGNEFNVLPRTHYSIRQMSVWLKDYTGLTPSQAYEKFYIKDILISFLQKGLEMKDALILLESMGINNPKKLSVPYSKDAMLNTIEYLFGIRSWAKLRKIFIEPIIAHMIRARLTIEEISENFAFGQSFVKRYLKDRWSYSGIIAAREFFSLNYLGYFLVDDLL